VAAIRDFSADVAGLQEVRPNQLDDLRDAFPTATIVGTGRDEDGGGEHASVLVPAARWTVESNETRWLSPTPDRPGSRGWDAKLPRVVTLVRLRHGDVRIGVANTHFDNEGAVARERSAGLIAEWLSQEPERPWVVLGDLNSVPGSPPVRRFAEAGYADALPPDAGGTEHAFTGATNRTRIDYVLTGPGIQVRSAWIGHERPQGRLPSDHWPVLADLAVE
jgi:endonuclease/exonuclease/phosphatase family metal-dependent hydrolase